MSKSLPKNIQCNFIINWRAFQEIGGSFIEKLQGTASIRLVKFPEVRYNVYQVVRVGICMNDNLLGAIHSRIERNEPARVLLRDLMRDAEVYLFGGAVRDYLDGRFESLRDMDFVVESRSDALIDIEGYFPDDADARKIRNRYNGYKVIFSDGLIMDIWNLEDTWTFKTGKLMATAENLIHTVYLNFDGVVYSLGEDKYLLDSDKRYERIKESGVLDIVNDETPFEELNLVRALVFRERYSMTFSDKLKGRMREVYSADRERTIRNFMEHQISHYNSVVLDEAKLKGILNAL